MSDLNTEIKIGADASGVEAGVGKAKRSLASLGDTAKKAGQDAAAGLTGIGTGGDASAKKVESATRSMQASLQRLVAEQKAGSKSSREYWEALANARGVNTSALKPLLDQLDAAKVKTVGATAATEGWAARLGSVGPMLAAAFSGAAVLNFTGKLVAVQREFDILNSSLITVTGSSANASREMDWIRKFAATTPYQLAEVTQAFVKMKSLGLDASEASLRSYGNTASAMGKNINQMIEAVADASTGEFERLKEFGIKARKDGDEVSLTFKGITTTIGNSADEITRYLRQIGEVDFASAMDERAKTLDGAISNLADSWEGLLLKVNQGGVGDAMSQQVKHLSTELGILGDVLDKAKESGAGFWETTGNVAGAATGRVAFQILQDMANVSRFALDKLTLGVFDLNSSLDLVPDNLKPVAVQMELMNEKLVNARGEYDALAARLARAPDNIYIKSELNQLDQYIQKLEEAKRKQAAMTGNAGPVGSVGSGDAALARAQRADYDKRKAALDGFMGKYATDGEKMAKEIASQKSALGDLYTPEVESRIRKQYTKGGGRGASGADAASREIAEQSKLLAELSGLTASFSTDWERLNTIYAKGQLSLEGLTDAQAKLLDKQPFAVALAREEADAVKALAKAREDDAKAYEDTINGRLNAAASVGAQVTQEREAIAAMGLSRNAVAELEAAKLSETAASKLRLAAIADEIDWSGRLGATYRDEAAQLQALASLKRESAAKQTGIDAAKEAADAWQKTADSIESGLTDALMRGFENGKSFGENMGDSLTNYFKTVVAREIATAITRAIVSAMASTQWGQLLSGVLGGGTGGGTDWLSMAGKAYDAYTKGAGAAAASSGAGASAGSGGAAAAAASAYGTTGTAGSAGGAAASTAAAGTASTAGTAGAASSASTSLMTYAGYAALIVAAVKVAENLYSTGYNRTALGVNSSKAGDNNSLGQYTYGRGNTTTGDSGARNWMSNGILALEATNQRRLMDAVGMNEKWADIFSGTTRMATLIGRKLKGYGYQANIDGADVDVKGYEYYKGGLFRSNKTVTQDVNKQDADELRAGIENVRESARAMAQAMGYSTEAIDNYSGSLKINLKGVKTGEEAAQRYGEAMEKLQRQMLNNIPGLKMNEEQFKEFIEGITKSMQDVGITAGGIADIITNGMLGRISQAQVGEQLSDMVIGGIYNAIAGQYAGQIASVFTGQIIQPIFTAIAAGVPISQAISQQAIANVVATAQNAAATLNAIFADPSFRAAISGVQQAISGISIAAGSVRAPAYKSAVSSYNAAAEAAKRAAEETRRAWKSVADSLSDEIRRIKGELLGDSSVGQSYYMAQFQDATAKARKGDQAAAAMLPELSQAVLDIARSTAGSLASLQYLQTSTIASLADTRAIISKKYGLKIPAFDVGTNYVPQDMLAQIHKGEAIVPKAYNPAAGGAGNGAGLLAQAQALRDMADSMTRMAAGISAIETNTRETRKTLDRVSQGGDALLTVAA
jgi:hypothetical protein